MRLNIIVYGPFVYRFNEPRSLGTLFGMSCVVIMPHDPEAWRMMSYGDGPRRHKISWQQLEVCSWYAALSVFRIVGCNNRMEYL